MKISVASIKKKSRKFEKSLIRDLRFESYRTERKKDRFDYLLEEGERIKTTINKLKLF